MKQTVPLLFSNSNVSFTEDIDIANLLASQCKPIYITDNGILPVFPKLTSASLDIIFIYPNSSNSSTPNCRNIPSYRHLKIWNDLDASVVKSTPLCKFKTSLSDIDLSPYLYYNRNIHSSR